MAAETIRAIVSRFPWTVGAAAAFAIGATLGAVEDFPAISDATSAVTMVALAVSVFHGKHPSISAFGLTAYLLYMLSALDAFAISVMIDITVCSYALSQINWRNRHAMRKQARPEKAATH